MPLIIVLVGLAVAVGFGSYFLNQNQMTTDAKKPEIVNIEETTPQPTTTNSSTTVTIINPESVGAQASTTNADTPVTTKTNVTTVTTTNTSTTTVVTTSATAFKDGTYTTVTSYRTPGGSNPKVDLSVTIKNDVITDTSISYTENNDGPSTNYQSKFTSAYKTLVIGQKLADVKLSRVGGASLTTNAFNAAIDQIEVNAKS